MRISIPSLRRQIKAQRYKDIPVTLSLLFIPVTLSLLMTEEVRSTCILLSVFIFIYVIGAGVIRKQRPMLFRPLLYAAGILLIIVLEKIL